MDGNTNTFTSIRLDSPATETPPEVAHAISQLIDAQDALAASIGEPIERQPKGETIEQLLTEAQRAANQIVERAELEALTIRRLMRIEAERLAENVERLKVRAAALEH